MGNLLPQSLYHQGDLSENTNQIADHDDDDLTIVDEKDKNETYETAIESVYFHNRILVEAYVRSIEEWVLYAIVADPIKQLICRYYNSWMKLPPPPKTTLVYPDPICYYSSAKQRDYIVFAPHVQDSKDLIQFDTKQHKWSVLTQYPDGFEYETHDPNSRAIDQTFIGQNVYRHMARKHKTNCTITPKHPLT
eukprot:54637_1